MFGILLRVLQVMNRVSGADIPAIIAVTIINTIYPLKKQGENSMTISTRKVLGLDGQDARGIKVTKNNVGNISFWIRTGNVDAEAVLNTTISSKGLAIVKDRVRLKTKKGWRVAHINDVVVKDKSGNFYVIKAIDFVGYI